jgi:hypothetical protein
MHSHVKWVPKTEAYRVIRLRMEENASRNGGKMRINSFVQPIEGGHIPWELREG